MPRQRRAARRPAQTQVYKAHGVTVKVADIFGTPFESTLCSCEGFTSVPCKCPVCWLLVESFSACEGPNTIARRKRLVFTNGKFTWTSVYRTSGFDRLCLPALLLFRGFTSS
jgi:hypothetical protein